MPSFDVVNYAIRPNKSVERKIVFSNLKRLSRVIDLTGHRYIGLGSIWFVDFLMAHRVLEIQTMLSIESDKIGLTRAKFNRPLSCIEVIPGESSEVIPDLNLETVPSLVWFDYDTSIGGPVLGDIGKLCPRCAPNSIVIITISAKLDDLPTKDENDERLNSEQALRRLAGDLVPTPLPAKRLQRSRYSKLLAEIVANKMQDATVRSGRVEVFIKLFDLTYADGTPMVTVGGIICDPAKKEEVEGALSSLLWEGIVAEQISVPPLTIREKLALDRVMPSANPPTDKEMKEIGFQLKREQIDMYHRFYLHYPIFGELV